MITPKNPELVQFLSRFPHGKEILGGSAWAFAGKALSMITGLAVNMLLARLLPPDKLGVYYLVLSIIAVSVLVAQIGLNWSVMKVVAESLGLGEFGKVKQAVLQALRLGSLGALVVALVLAFGGTQAIAGHLFHSQLVADVSGLTALLVALAVFQNIAIEIQRGFHDIRLATILGNTGSDFLLMVCLLGLWFIKRTADIFDVLDLSIFINAAIILIAFVVIRRMLLKLPRQESPGTPGTLWSVSWGMWMTQLLLFVWSQADLWVVGSFLAPQDVALYGTAVRLMALVNVPLIVVNAVIPPIITSLSAQNKYNELEKVLRTTATFAAIPSMGILLILAVFGGPILSLLFGTYYHSAATVLVILSIGQMINVWAGSCGETLLFTGHQQTMMKISAVGAVVTLGGALLLVHPYGQVGVAVAAMAGMSLQNLLALLLSKRKLGIWTHATFKFASMMSS